MTRFIADLDAKANQKQTGLEFGFAESGGGRRSPGRWRAT
jgi:hypothetical protein